MKRSFCRVWIILVLSCTIDLRASETLINHDEVVWSRIDPKSFIQYVSFIQLFPQSPRLLEAKERLLQFCSLYTDQEVATEFVNHLAEQNYSSQTLDHILKILFPQIVGVKDGKHDRVNELSPIEKRFYKKLEQTLSSPYWKSVQKLEDLKELGNDEIDVVQVSITMARQSGKVITEEEEQRLHAQVDVLALMAAMRLPSEPSLYDIVDAINRILFFDQKVSYPPRSQDKTHIDQYSSLPQILSSRKGVCLGTSVLFWALAQRLNLPLEAVTVPGHIYLQIPITNYQGSIDYRRVETTARGIHLPEEVYRPLQKNLQQVRDLKQTLAFVFINEASMHLSSGAYSQAAKLYKLSLPILNQESDLFCLELYSYAMAMSGECQKALEILNSIAPRYRSYIQDPTSEESLQTLEPLLCLDLVENKVSWEVIRDIFAIRDMDYKSKERALHEWKGWKKKYPKSSLVAKYLAISFLNLKKENEALSSFYDMGEGMYRDTSSLMMVMNLQVARQDWGKTWDLAKKISKRLSQKDRQPKSPWALWIWELMQKYPSAECYVDLLQGKDEVGAVNRESSELEFALKVQS
jgi:regulator of sirC expression with transglutaminase-like and TPR domain